MHEFETKFEAHAGGGPEAFGPFVIKTMTFVSEQLQEAFPQTPVYGTLGNDDAICGNYMIAPGQTFLAAVGELWAAHSAHPEAFADFGVGGFYVVPHPTVQDRDLIVLNTVLWSTNYQNRCNPAGGDPGAAQLAWLEWTLYRTKLRGRTASLLFHIPPGIDSYYSSHGSGTCRDERHAVPEGSVRAALPCAARALPGHPAGQLCRAHPHGRFPGAWPRLRASRSCSPTSRRRSARST